LTQLTFHARQANLESHFVPNFKVFNLEAYGTNDAGRLMAQRQGLLHNDVAIAVMIEVVKVRATESGGLDSNLHFIRSWRRKAAILLYESHVSR
jgi:hypothetical protein